MRLVAAVELGRPEAVRLLVELGYDVDGTRGTPPLHLAAYAGNPEMVELVLELGADPTRRDPQFAATASGWARHAGTAPTRPER